MTRIETIDQLRELYRAPSELVRSKVQATLDSGTISFIERSPMVFLSTIGADGHLDVSPRGGPSGFLRVLTNGTVAIPDLNGNNLLDTLEAIVATGRVGMLFVLPGQCETVRVNGRAHISVDPEILTSFTPELRTPRSAIIVEPEEVFIHCAKAFRRGHVWDPDTWEALNAGPDVVDILYAQLALGEKGVDKAALRENFAKGYATELDQDKPE